MTTVVKYDDRVMDRFDKTTMHLRRSRVVRRYTRRQKKKSVKSTALNRLSGDCNFVDITLNEKDTSNRVSLVYYLSSGIRTARSNRTN
jgi:hypothetical protein